MKKMFLLTIVFFIGTISYAATKTWIGASGGTWSTGSNWSGGTPTSVDDVVFNTSVTVIVDGSKTVNSLLVTSNAAVIFQGSSTTTTLTLNCSSCTSSIDAGSTLTICGNAISNKCEITLANTAIFNINGTLNVGVTGQTATQRLLPTAGTVTTVNGRINIVGGGANVTAASAGSYVVNGTQDMQRNGGIFSVGTYATTATNLISGTIATLPIFNSSQTTTWGTIEMNAPGNTNVGASGTSLFSSNAICQNFKVTNTGTGNCTIAASGSNARVISVNGNLSIASGATANINSTSAGANATASGFDVMGDVTIDGTLTETGSATGSRITMINTASKNISVTGSITNDVSLVINGAGGVVALTDINLSGSSNALLTLTNGKITLGSNNLTVTNTAPGAITGHSASAYIITNGTGALKRGIATATGTYNFPVGSVANYKPAVITYTTAPVATGTLAARFNNTYPGFPNITPLVEGSISNINGVSVQGSWFIEDPGSIGGTFTGVFTANGSGDVTDYTKAVLLKRPSSGGDWGLYGTHIATTGSNANPVVSRSGMTGFSEFAIGGELSVALPVNVSYFNGIKQGGANVLNWKVNCTSTSGVSFVIERSADNSNYNALNIITATSVRCLQPFGYTDHQPAAGYNYYRLKITYDNGRVIYSDAVVLVNKETGFDIVNMLPTVVNSQAVLNITTAQKMPLEIVVTDLSGRQVHKKVYNLVEGNNQVQINFSGLAAGTYQITGFSPQGKTRVIRFIKQ